MDLISLIQDGSTSFLYLAAVGLVLGSLHGLEPGHSKTMMAAFIVAVRGTPFSGRSCWAFPPRSRTASSYGRWRCWR